MGFNIVPTEPKEQEPTTSGSGSFLYDENMDKIFVEMAEDKEPFENEILDLDTAELAEDAEGGYTEVSESQRKRSNDTAKFVINMADTGLSVLFASYAHAADSKEFEADQDDRDQLIEYWGIYFQETSASLPPWVMALVVTLMVLGKKMNHAKQVRAANIRAELAEAEAAEAKKELEKEKSKAKESK